MDDTISRLPPQNIQAEQAILCAMLLDSEAYDGVRTIISGEDFHKPEHRLIFNSIAKTGGDVIAVITDLKESGYLDKIGGPIYLSKLSDIMIPSKTMAKHHAKLVREASRKRVFISKAGEMIAGCYSGDDFETVAADLEREAFKLSESLTDGGEAESIGSIVRKSVDRVEKISREGVQPGIMTGFTDIDTMTSGFRESELIILAARPSMGKSALAFNIMRKMATNKIPVGGFSLEMGKGSLGERMLSDVTKINSKNIRSGWINDKDWPTITAAMQHFNDMPMYIDDTPALHISEIRSRARRMKRKYGVEFIVLDYLQMARGDGGSREQEVADISRGLKAMAKELNIPVMALAQLNRGLESRPNKKPMLSDLRESGAIEQDADVISFIYRDDYYNKDTNNPRKGIAEIIFGKQRNGPTGTVELLWHEQTCSFDNLERYHG